SALAEILDMHPEVMPATAATLVGGDGESVDRPTLLDAAEGTHSVKVDLLEARICHGLFASDRIATDHMIDSRIFGRAMSARMKHEVAGLAGLLVMSPFPERSRRQQSRRTHLTAIRIPVGLLRGRERKHVVVARRIIRVRGEGLILVVLDDQLLIDIIATPRHPAVTWCFFP